MNKMITIVLVVVIGIFAVLFLLNRSNPSTTQSSKITPTSSVLGLLSSPLPTRIQTSLAPSAAQTIEVVKNATSAAIKTQKGNIEIELYPKDAPKTVANFATLAKYGYYNNLTFHRVEPGFVIQGGDPKGDGTGGISIFGPKFEDELNPNSKSYQEGYKEGVVAMANSGPNTNGSQFFIMLADAPQLPKNYTIFGKVIKGIDVVKRIAVGDKMTSIEISE